MRKQPRLRYFVWTVLGLCLWMPAFGQDSKDDIIQKLISRVEALEREVAALKPGATPQQTVATAPPEQAPAPPPQAPVAVEAVAPADAAEPFPTGENRFTLHAYGDIGFLRNPDGSSIKRFALGELDVFASARITPKLSALVEAVFETDNQLYVSTVPINVERLLLQYRQNDFFNVDIGSYRTAIGYYNTAFLRGAWFQTALTRPKLFVFEDDGGFLPLHNTGVSVNGLLPSGGLGLRYVVEVGNSRNYGQGIRTGLDIADHSAFNVALTARPPALPGFQTGFSFYRDQFSPFEGAWINRSVWTGHAVYQAKRIEFLNEVVLAKFARADLGWGNAQGFYSQLAYRMGSSWTPYVRFEDLNSYGRGPAGDSVRQYMPWRTIVVSGLRYDITEAVAFKFEIGRADYLGQPAWVQAAMQVAFRF
jgi:hypothetical protein